MSEWKEIELGEVAEVQTGPFGSQLKNEQYIVGGTPVVTVEHIQDFRITNFDYPSITDEDRSRLSKYLMKKGDILFTRVGSVDLSAYVSEKQDGWMFSSRMLRVRPNEDVNSRYLSYFFQQKIFREYILNISVGATMPSINTEILKTIPISYPPLPEQKSIASVLSSLDDKIDLLHRQNQTLEQMAETLFRQWFVEEADEGWEEGVISDYAKHLKVSIKPGVDPLKLYAHFSIPGFDASKEPVFEIGQEIRSNKYQVVGNSILFSKLNPHKDKRIWLILDELPENAICSTEFQILNPYKESHLYFLYGWLSNFENYRELSSGVGGTSGSHQRISPNEIFSFPIPIVSDGILKEYAKTIKPIFEKQQNNQTQIRTLTSMRDTLLPKLMSGEVRVKE
ncbi:MAG: restriction endonuclease subunit S [Mangrovibacterium sp.]